ncbi:MAG: bifunctional N(6)-L-threonylcarbamoyladenine synthase/serine/threonine protein kinase [Candidatus Ranarchaeia archaeon]
MQSKQLCLGLEGTAHTFGASIVDTEGNVLSNVRDIYVPIGGGIHPREAMFHHASVAPSIIKTALDEASCSCDQINVVAFSQGPGLGPCLRTTATAARAISINYSIPLIGVNHCVAHVEIGKLATDAVDPLTVYLSGGNSLVTAATEGRYRVFGETLDIAIGNLLDTFARAVGLPHPGGPKIEVLARNVSSDQFIELPYTVKGMDLSFSGLFTKAVSRYKALGDAAIPALCYSIQEIAFAMVAEVTERALAHTKKRELLLTGGVAQNKRLQSMLHAVAEEHDAVLFIVPSRFAGDNAAMIAWTGILQYRYHDYLSIPDSVVLPRWRIDEAETPWLEKN